MSNQNKIPEGFLLAKDGKIWLSGDVFFKDAWNLAEKLKPRFADYPHLYCLARGGYSFGSVVGNCFGRNDIHSLMVESYKGEESGELSINSELPPELLKSKGEGMIIFEDLVHTGKTFLGIREIFPKAYFAAVYAKLQGEETADVFLRQVPDRWIVFPWENSMKNFVPAA